MARLDRRHLFPAHLTETKGGRWIGLPLLVPMAMIYALLVQGRHRLYEWGILPRRRLPGKVVCVGNMTMGGTGKTPMAEYVARLLKGAGLRVALLSRGYKGTKEKGLGVVSNGEAVLLSAKEAGDEPYLLAHRLEGVPVLVGSNRYRSGRLAHERFGTEVAVLDDGYQHIQLARDVDILLVDGREGFGNGHLFPWGLLREPLKGLIRAHHVVITKAEDRDRTHAIEETLRRWNPEAGIYRGRYVPQSFLDPYTGDEHDLGSLRGRKIVAFAGLANPESFFDLLRSLGAVLLEEIVFPDHHPYGPEDLNIIRRNLSHAEWVVTTEKDMARLEDLDLAAMPLRVLEVTMEISEGDAFRAALFAALEVGELPPSGEEHHEKEKASCQTG
jgi:tetraacyldisaccharide 4'-kinase